MQALALEFLSDSLWDFPKRPQSWKALFVFLLVLLVLLSLWLDERRSPK
jgi:hypothetical protein